MKQSACIGCLIMLFLLFSAFTKPLFAEQVSHHGLMADAEGLSYYCLSCHDGSTAKNIDFSSATCGTASIHMFLQKYPPRHKEARFFPIEDVEMRGIRIVDNQVECISCHEIRNPERYHLVITNDGSSLCQGCHIK